LNFDYPLRTIDVSAKSQIILRVIGSIFGPLHDTISGVQDLMGCIDNSKLQKTLKKWFFIDKRVG
jgi:hypothetical protein